MACQHSFHSLIGLGLYLAFCPFCTFTKDPGFQKGFWAVSASMRSVSLLLSSDCPAGWMRSLCPASYWVQLLWKTRKRISEGKYVFLLISLFGLLLTSLWCCLVSGYPAQVLPTLTTTSLILKPTVCYLSVSALSFLQPPSWPPHFLHIQWN